ncbi:MAG: polynucleotide adenylyltransferase PcnB [Gammaproteobacteria bacterium]|nr:MAG: polynucleotide adenylyltransferase PcnB [Gammaproteobacteria bacterium]
MIKTIMGWVNRKSDPRPTLKIIPRDQHPVSRKLISPNALKVLYRLNKAGYEAYIVGGGVRDILLGQPPKDFDVATSATPEQVKALFSNCRLIGRRFRLAHVHFGREIIEVATFRAQLKPEEAARGKAEVSEDGQITRDNVWGTKEEDALRRDFTINALYYNVEDFSIHDHAGGMEDIAARRLRLIGDPETRYREDPVRMLRAIRFAAKLDFSIDPATARPIRDMAPLLENIPAARLFEEVLKLFMSGHGVRSFDLLREYGLFKPLFPQTDALLESGDAYSLRLIRAALANTDERIRADKPVTPAFLYAAMLWPVVQQGQARFMGQHSLPPMQALQEAAADAIGRQVRSTALPKRFSLPMKEIWEMQLRLTRKQRKRAEALVTHPRFRAAYDFLLLRELAGEDLGGLGAWWTAFQEGQPVAEAPSGQRKRRRRRPRRKKPDA